MAAEATFQTKFIKKLRGMFPQAIILKNDSGYQQGIPDWTIMWGRYWALLEIKPERPTRPEDFEPNQEWFIELAAEMSFGACVYPENEEEVLHALQQAFRPRRTPRLPNPE